MSDIKNRQKIKARGHRKKKFGNEQSKVISFRIAKTVYENNKEEIRNKITKVIEMEVQKKKTKNS
ncbi:MAG: hypothetical protein JSV23_04485 [Promethearchaeota archaeon]|nr:MAG: hypothetical protein JSV23_04485 [Candidatus Lokiarchaeota archaeon]